MISRILTCFFILSLTHAKTFVISQEIPQSISYLMQEYANDLKGTKEEKLKTLNSFLNRYFNLLNEYEKEMTLIILNNSYSMKLKSKRLSHKLLKSYQASINTKIQDQRVFSKYISQRFYTDASEILTDTHYAKYERYLDKKIVVKDKDIAEIERKINIILPWIQFINKSSSESLDDFFKNNNEMILKDLKKITQFYTFYSPITDSIKSKQFVTLFDQGLDKARKEIDALDFKLFPSTEETKKIKSITELEKNPQTLPKSVDDWIPIDDTIEDSEGLPLTKDQLFPAPSEIYDFPKTLPRSSDEDW